MRTLALAALIAVGAAWAAPVRAAAPDRQDSKQTWEDYRIQARKDLDMLGDKIAALELRAKAVGTEARANLQAQAKSLRSKKGEGDRLLDQFETATESARKELRIKLDRTTRELKKSIHKAEAKPQDRT